MGKSYGYIRVSTKEQNEDRQLEAMRKSDVPDKNIFSDKQSGGDFERPQYRRMMGILKNDDVLYVKSTEEWCGS